MKYKSITLYSTEACHLCENAKLVFQNVAEKQRHVDSVVWKLEVVDIAKDEGLFELYGVRIPVLKLKDSSGDDGGELGWPFDEQQLDSFLMTFNSM